MIQSCKSKINLFQYAEIKNKFDVTFIKSNNFICGTAKPTDKNHTRETVYDDDIYLCKFFISAVFSLKELLNLYISIFFNELIVFFPKSHTSSFFLFINI